MYIDLGYIDLTKRVPEIDKFLNDSHFTKLEITWVALGYKEGMFPVENRKSNNIRNLHDALSRCGAILMEKLQEQVAFVFSGKLNILKQC